MSRPAFKLSDDQGRQLVAAILPLQVRHPIDARSHRPFLADFLRAVFDVTGKTHSPAIYRRLLGAYAPGRNPSTNTIVLEKNALEQELAQSTVNRAVDHTELGDESGSWSPSDIKAAVRQALEPYLQLLAQQASENAPVQHDAYYTYMAGRLSESDAALADARTTAARLAADLQEARATIEHYQSHLAVAESAFEKQMIAQSKVADELADMRKFAMMSIEGARGEARELRDQVRQVQLDLKRRDNELDALRRAGYHQAVANTSNPPAGTR